MKTSPKRICADSTRPQHLVSCERSGGETQRPLASQRTITTRVMKPFSIPRCLLTGITDQCWSKTFIFLQRDPLTWRAGRHNQTIPPIKRGTDVFFLHGALQLISEICYCMSARNRKCVPFVPLHLCHIYFSILCGWNLDLEKTTDLPKMQH